jgi:hypothetical protein
MEFVWLERVEEAVTASLEPKKPADAPSTAPLFAEAEA